MIYLSEHYLVFVVLAGILMVVAAYGWCLVRAFRKGPGWGLLSLLLPPVALFWSVSSSPREGRRPGGPGPIALALLGSILVVATITWNTYQANYATFAERERIVEGNRHITLTGWNKDDYSLLAKKPDVYLLQMANEDVTNDTLELIKGFSYLEVLDIRDAQIDDDGLALVATLPQLRVLYLSRTRVTDEGFRKHLADKPHLMEITASGTGILSKTLRDWKKANPDRKFVN